MTKTR